MTIPTCYEKSTVLYICKNKGVVPCRLISVYDSFTLNSIISYLSKSINPSVWLKINISFYLLLYWTRLVCVEAGLKLQKQVFLQQNLFDTADR